MAEITNEYKFQKWVMDRFKGAQGHVQDFSAVGNDVPDLSIACGDTDYWLELKYGEFRMLHTKYDDFYWRTLTRGQLNWLVARAKAKRTAVVGILGYALARGDHGKGTPYLVFHAPQVYLNKVWQKKGYTIGSVLLSDYSVAFGGVQTGADLRAFLHTASQAPATLGESLAKRRVAT